MKILLSFVCASPSHDQYRLYGTIQDGTEKYEFPCKRSADSSDPRGQGPTDLEVGIFSKAEARLFVERLCWQGCEVDFDGMTFTETGASHPRPPYPQGVGDLMGRWFGDGASLSPSDADLLRHVNDGGKFITRDGKVFADDGSKE